MTAYTVSTRVIYETDYSPTDEGVSDVEGIP
jgi:hypothetical protein